MRKVLTVVLLVAVLAGAMLAITLLVPDVRALADDTAKRSHLPWVIVGLLAPILYVIKRIGEWLKGLLSSTAEEQIEAKNREIKEQLAQLRTDVAGIEARRARELGEHQQQIAALEARLAPVLAQIAQVDRDLADVEAKPAADFAPSRPEDLWGAIKKNVPGYAE
jgi:hypothetical protein